jgi:Tol biopolymer transport system component
MASRAISSAAIVCGVLCFVAGVASADPAEPQVALPSPTVVPPADRASLRGRIAYSTQGGDIWVMNANGSGKRRITRSGRGIDFDPSLSPNGRYVVFRTSRGRYLPDTKRIGLEGIFVVDTQTRREHPIHPPQGALFPDWSPDGKLIAFSTTRRAGGETIHVAKPSGRGFRDLTTGSFQGAQEAAAWSPDGRRIAYDGHSGDGNWAVWVMNRDGSGRQQLTHPTLIEPAGSRADYTGAWSPDGKQLVYSSAQIGDNELYVMNADGSDVRRLTEWPGGDGAVAWLRSGQIVFSHFTGNEPLPHWYMVDPDGSNLRALPWLYGAGDPLDWVQPR